MTLSGLVGQKQTETEHMSLYAVPVKGRTGYLKITASLETGEVCLSIQLSRTSDATGHSGPDDEDDGA